MKTIKKIHHVAMVVSDLEKSLSFWQDALGMDVGEIRDVPEQKARIAFLPAGGSEIELVLPTDPESGMGRYLAKRGPGMHHVCLEVVGIDALLVDLKAKGVRMIDEFPRLGAQDRKYAFVHPESTGGVLVELYELPHAG